MRAVLVLALAAVGCATSQPAGTIPPESQTPAGQLSPGGSIPSLGATPVIPSASLGQPTEPPVTTRPATARPTPRATANATKGDPILRTWSDGGYVTAQIILPVQNTGGIWIELSDFESNFTIYHEDGGIIETGSFYIAAPTLLGPGEEGYLLGETFSDDEPASAYARVDADAYYDDARPSEVELTVENTDVKKQSYGELEVSGEVRNPGTERIDSATVAAVFLDDRGEVLGFAWTYLDNIEPNDTRAFEATTSADIGLADIAETIYYASDESF